MITTSLRHHHGWCLVRDIFPEIMAELFRWVNYSDFPRSIYIHTHTLGASHLANHQFYGTSHVPASVWIWLVYGLWSTYEVGCTSKSSRQMKFTPRNLGSGKSSEDVGLKVMWVCLPSGNDWHNYMENGHGSSGFSSQNGDMFHSYVKLPEDVSWIASCIKNHKY